MFPSKSKLGLLGKGVMNGRKVGVGYKNKNTRKIQDQAYEQVPHASNVCLEMKFNSNPEPYGPQDVGDTQVFCQLGTRADKSVHRRVS